MADEPAASEGVVDVTPPTPAPTPSEPTSDPTATPSPADSDDLISYIRTEHGVDLSKKYTDPGEALKGLLEAYKKVGERDENAARWQQFQQHIAGREQEFEQFLQGNKAAPVPTSDDWLANTSPEQVRAWQALSEAGKATPDVTAKLAKVQERVWETMVKLALRGDEVLSPLVEKKTKELENRLQQMSQSEEQRTFQSAINAWATQNATLLYVDGDVAKGDTTIGTKTRELYESPELCEDIPNPVKRAGYALKLALADAPKGNAPKPPSARALRQPSVAAEPRKTLSADEFFAQWKGPPGSAIAAYQKHLADGGAT